MTIFKFDSTKEAAQQQLPIYTAFSMTQPHGLIAITQLYQVLLKCAIFYASVWPARQCATSDDLKLPDRAKPISLASLSVIEQI